jgi:hypothetical protein
VRPDRRCDQHQRIPEPRQQRSRDKLRRALPHDQRDQQTAQPSKQHGHQPITNNVRDVTVSAAEHIMHEPSHRSAGILPQWPIGVDLTTPCDVLVEWLILEDRRRGHEWARAIFHDHTATKHVIKNVERLTGVRTQQCGRAQQPTGNDNPNGSTSVAIVEAKYQPQRQHIADEQQGIYPSKHHADLE